MSVRVTVKGGRGREGRPGVLTGDGAQAWAASATFHARDVPATEAADYMLADAVVVWGTLAAAARVGGCGAARLALCQP